MNMRADMTQILTQEGLTLPDTCSEQDFINIGTELTRRENQAQSNLMLVQWLRGEWWNALPDGRKAEICEASGSNAGTANNCGAYVARAKKMNLIRDEIQSFKHVQIIAHQSLTDTQRTDLLQKSTKYEWTASRLRQERDILIGKPEKEKHEATNLDAKIEELIADLPARTSRKVKREIKAIVKELEGDFNHQVEQRADAIAKKRTANVFQLEADAKAANDAASDLLMSVQVKMTQDEFNIVRGCLHPDKQPESEQAKFSRAFEIFNRLKPVIPKGIPLDALRKAGWEKAHPRYRA